VDGYVPGVTSRGRALAGIELVSPRHRALCLLHRYSLEQRVYLPMSSTLIGRRGLWHASDHSRRCGYVLTSAGEVWEAIIVLDDPPVYVVGHGVAEPPKELGPRAPIVVLIDLG